MQNGNKKTKKTKKMEGKEDTEVQKEAIRDGDINLNHTPCSFLIGGKKKKKKKEKKMKVSRRENNDLRPL